MTIKRKFTLIELIAAMSIMLMVTMIISTVIAVFYKAYEQTALLSDRLSTEMTISRVMDRLVRNAVPFVWEDEDSGEEELVFLGESHELIISALTRTYLNDDGGLIFARIYLSNGTLYCEYSSFPILPWEDSFQTNTATEVLTNNVSYVTFTYLAITDGELEYLDEWDTDDTYSTSIPAGIQMEIGFTDGTKERWLRRTAGSSYHTSLGLREDSSE